MRLQRELRESEGLTLDALSERVGTTNQQISHLEMGKRKLTVDWLRRLAKTLGCHPWMVVECDLPAVTDVNERDVLKLFRSPDRARKDALLGYLGLIELVPPAHR